MKIFVYSATDGGNGRWKSILFRHPSTLDTMAMETDINKVKSNLDLFLFSHWNMHFEFQRRGSNTFILAPRNALEYQGGAMHNDGGRWAGQQQ